MLSNKAAHERDDILANIGRAEQAIAHLTEEIKELQGSMAACGELVHARASKAAVANALKRKVNQDEFDAALNHMLLEVKSLLQQVCGWWVCVSCLYGRVHTSVENNSCLSTHSNMYLRRTRSTHTIGI